MNRLIQLPKRLGIISWFLVLLVLISVSLVSNAQIVLSTDCATGKANLSVITAQNQPANTSLTWHTGSPATTVNQLTSVTAVSPGTYYAAFFDSANNCYSTATTSVSVTISQCAQPPIAVNDVAQTTAGTSVTANVLTNDSDPNSPALLLTAGLLSQPSAGTVVMSPTGSYTYTPPASFTGTTSFCYSASNTAGLSSSACVTVTVVPAPKAPLAADDTFLASLNAAATGNVASNDSDPNSPPLALTYISGQPAHGSVVMSPAGSYTYTPATGYTGPDSFTYSVCNSAGKCVVATVTGSVMTNVIILLTNTCPATTVNLTTAIWATNTPAGTVLSWHSGTPATGANQLTSTTAVGAGMYYAAFFDSANNCYSTATASVSVTISQCAQPPIAVNDVAQTTAGTSVTANVLTNDSDPNSPALPLTAGLLSQPSAGTVVMSPTGSYTYTPPASFTGTTSFCYSASNTAGLSSSACVTVTVVPALLPPLAVNDGLILAAPGVGVYIDILSNDKAPDGSAATNSNVSKPVIISPPTKGTFQVTGINNVGYTPSPTATGSDSFVYQICNLLDNTVCSSATVTIGIDPQNAFPVLVDDGPIPATPGSPVNIPVFANDKNANGTPATLAYTTLPTIYSQPTKGTVVVNVNGTVTYTPSLTASGSDSFVYKSCNVFNNSACKTATVTLIITPLPPVVVPDIATTNVNTPVLGNVLTNDSNQQGGALTVSVSTLPTTGTVTMTPTGSYTYTPPTGFTGVASFCYSATNTLGLSASTCVTVTVVPVPSSVTNNAPIASNDAIQTTAGVPVTVVVLANDTDPDSATSVNGQLNNPTIVSQPSMGTALVNASGTVTYTPPATFTGVVTFPYQMCDKATTPLCTTALVTVNVQPTPPMGTTLSPVAVDDALLTSLNTPKSGNVSTNDSDPNRPALPLTYTAGQPTSGTVVMSPTGSYTYTPAPGFTGPTNFIYSVCNTASKCDVATVGVLVQSGNQVTLLPKVWLQGALFGVTAANGLMRDDLRTKNLIPASSPYGSFSALTTVGPVSNTAVVFGVTGNDAIVDWVFVELRSPSNFSLVVDSRAALVQRDGDIVEIDGVSPVAFSASQGSYYVSVKHRNHLGVMTASAIPLSVTGTSVDFRTPATATYRATTSTINQSQVTVVQGVALWAGNVVYDKSVIYQGTTNDVSAIANQVKGPLNIAGNPSYILSGYYTGDVNLDGRTIYQGTGNDVNYIYLNVTKNHPGNAAGQNFFVIREQLP